MVATTGVAQRIESGLRAVLAEVADLPTTAAEWNTLPDENRASFALDWSHLMADYLAELDRYHGSGAMSPDQQMRYRELLCKLKETLPTIQRLNLYAPSIPLGA